MRARFAAVAAVWLVAWASDSGVAWTRLSGNRSWPSGSIVMHMQLGSSGSLADGSASWNASAEAALARWNTFLSTVSFRVVRDSTAGIGLRNGTNNVFWDDDVYGDSFGDAVAVAFTLPSSTDRGRTTESDVIFNRALRWDSYRGNLRRVGGETVYDLRRVALHEFGHTLGLDHPDEGGQSVAAVMNSRISNTDDLQSDDINGVRAIYGGTSTPTPTPPPTNRSPTVTASCSPCTVEIGRTSALRATASDPDGDSLTYQWSAPQGGFSVATAAATTWTAPAQPGSVTATVRVQDSRGASATATVALQVVVRDRLIAGSRLTAGQSITSANARYRLVYQGDSNLVLYDDVARGVVWATYTSGSPGVVVLQGDGNLVIYDAQGRVLWATGTAGNPNAVLYVQPDGNLVLYSSTGQPIWTR